MTLTLAGNDAGFHRSNVDRLYADALLIADEARAWFDRARGRGAGQVQSIDDPLRDWAGRHDPSLRIALSCESLRLTTRLMHVIAWLLLHRAIIAGELDPAAARDAHNRLGPSPAANAALRSALPDGAQRLIDASLDLHRRAAILDAMLDEGPSAEHPVHGMLARLRTAL